MIKTACDETDKNDTVVAYSKTFVFRIVEIGGKDNQCLQFALYVFYKDVNEIKQASVLWNLINWSNIITMRTNENAFVFNRMIGYNTAFYDIFTKLWYWDEVNSQAATWYVKFDNLPFEYIQPLRPRTDFSYTINNKEQILPIDQINDKEIVLPIAKDLSISSSFRGYCQTHHPVVYSCNG